METEVEPPAKPASLFLIWCRLSAMSFGGGVTTLGLIRQEFVTRRGWVTEEQFLRDWSLCQLAPGINLIALVILLGRRLGGALSIAAALSGLLLPSFFITVGITAGYQHFSGTPFVTAARSGVVPAIAGIGFATATSMLVPIAKKHYRENWWVPGFYSLIFAGCFLSFRLAHLSPVVVLVSAGLGGVIFNCLQPKKGEQL